MPKLSINFEEIISCAQWNSEEKKKVLGVFHEFVIAGVGSTTRDVTSYFIPRVKLRVLLSVTNIGGGLVS